ncbi:MAG TPA: hypothetical protein VFP87_03880 [Chitinophagaceae bacterium]|nr:hypothetical protein [Chitinophagaceae bacterium]
MTKIASFILVIGTTAIMLPSAQASALSQVNHPSGNGYDAGSIYQIELSANVPSPRGGGVWLWIGLNPNGQGDYKSLRNSLRLFFFEL